MGNVTPTPVLGPRKHDGAAPRSNAVQPIQQARGTVEVTIHYPKSLQDSQAANFTEAGFDSLLLTLQEQYPNHNVMLRAKAVNEYRKTLPSKNSGFASPASIKPDVAFHVGTFPSLENEVRNFLQSHLDPGNICSFTPRRFFDRDRVRW